MTRLLAGGNPQIPKGDGEAPVRAWIDALPDWRREAARDLDARIAAVVPEVRRAVRWNSPFWGAAPGEWFASVHAFDRYLKLAFFAGAELDPPPPVGSRQPRVRYLHVAEGPPPGPELEDWVAQAARRPGWRT